MRDAPVMRGGGATAGAGSAGGTSHGAPGLEATAERGGSASPRDAVGGLFISFEGCEGAGKTTQVNMLRDYLSELGREVTVTREPGGTEVGEKLRSLLLDPGTNGMAAVTEALLFAANRAQVVGEVVRPALEQGAVVIADRFVDSSLAYQGVGRGLGLEAVKNLNDWATGNLLPDLTFYMDIPFDESTDRRLGREPDRIEKEAGAFHENVRKAYHTLALVFPDRITRVDAKASVDEIHARVTSIIDRLL